MYFVRKIKSNIDVYESLKRISSILVASRLYKSLLMVEVLEIVLEKFDSTVGV
jgi:type III secretory pathway component EscU